MIKYLPHSILWVLPGFSPSPKPKRPGSANTKPIKEANLLSASNSGYALYKKDYKGVGCILTSIYICAKLTGVLQYNKLSLPWAR